MSELNNEHCRAIRPLDLAMALTSPLVLDVWLGIDGLPIKKGLGVRPCSGNCLIRVSYLSGIRCFCDFGAPAQPKHQSSAGLLRSEKMGLF